MKACTVILSILAVPALSMDEEGLRRIGYTNYKIYIRFREKKNAKYVKNVLKINIYARKVGRKHFTVHSKLNFVV